MKRLVKSVGIVAVAAVVALGLANVAQAASLGYGIFLGTWYSQPGTPDGNENPKATEAGADLIGSLILNDPQKSGTAPGAFTPDPFDIDEFNVAGSRENPGSNTSTSLQFTFNGGSLTGGWTYAGTPGAQDPTSPGNPGQDPIDLYVAVKYATFFSVFYYANVNPGDDGTITSDGANLTSANLDLTLPGYGGSYSYSFGSSCDPNNVDDPVYCMAYQNSSPNGLSHAVGYWPPGETVIPLPPAILFLGTAIAGLAGFASIRRTKKVS